MHNSVSKIGDKAACQTAARLPGNLANFCTAPVVMLHLESCSSHDMLAQCSLERIRHSTVLQMTALLTPKAVLTCLQSPAGQHAAWFRELECESMLMAVHDNLYKMEEYAVHSSAEAYVGTLGKQYYYVFRTRCVGCQPEKSCSCITTVVAQDSHLLRSLPISLCAVQLTGQTAWLLIKYSMMHSLGSGGRHWF